MTEKAERNDRNRQALGTNGQMVVVRTKGVANLPEAVGVEVLKRVREFDTFTEDNDPWGEHDFGAFELTVPALYVCGPWDGQCGRCAEQTDPNQHCGESWQGEEDRKFFWKIDDYSESPEGSLPEGWPPLVLTIMLAEEY